MKSIKLNQCNHNQCEITKAERMQQQKTFGRQTFSKPEITQVQKMQPLSNAKQKQHITYRGGHPNQESNIHIPNMCDGPK